MKVKLRLLPHWCQVFGYTYWFVFLLVCCLIQIMYSVDPHGVATEFVSDILSPLMDNWEIVGIFNYLMLVMAAFSRERVEDEVMLMLRLRSLVVIVVLNLLLAVASIAVPESMEISHVLSDISEFFTSDFGVIILLYLAIFKISVWIHRLRSF